MIGKKPWFFAFCMVVLAVSAAAASEQPATARVSQSEQSNSTKPNNRADSLRALAQHLRLGKGSTIADVGAGGGTDTLVFAEIVGRTGTVFSEEIVESKVKLIEKKAREKKLSQVRPVLGRDNDPRLPPASADMVFLRYVYHHFAKPREMLRGLWRSLKPGGYLVVVDKLRGTLRDWVPQATRTKKHHWIAETTVVRQAREEGFAFVECAEGCWYGKEDFVLVFQRPQGLEKPGSDPDALLPLDCQEACRFMLPPGFSCQRPVIIALGEARQLIASIVKRAPPGQAVEIVLEEWATQKEERPPLPAGVSFPSVLTEEGDPKLGPESILTP